MSVVANPSTITLDRLPVRRSAKIVRLHGDPSRVVRLMELGLMEGETLEMLGAAPLGDPLAVRIRGSRLALRRHEAALIDVECLESP
jgi:ferrous iron transport protein A